MDGFWNQVTIWFVIGCLVLGHLIKELQKSPWARSFIGELLRRMKQR